MGGVPDSVAAIARTHQAVLESRGVRTSHGAFYTPIHVAERIVDIALADRIARIKGPQNLPRVIDPSCGTGNFLVVVALRLADRMVELGASADDAITQVVSQCIHGVDIDPVAVALCREQLSALTNGRVPVDQLHDRITEGNPLLDRGSLYGFDVVVGNPPFLDQQSSSTTLSRDDHRAISRTFGSRADAINALTNPAAVFLLAALDMVTSDGVVAMLQPASFLTSRDTGGVRAVLGGLSAAFDIWVTREQVFDAAVHVCAVMVDQSRRTKVHVHAGDGEPIATETRVLSERTWAFAPATLEGVPDIWIDESNLLGFFCAVTADFRDQYYGLVGHVVDNAEPSDGDLRLVTSGLIDPFTCRWGAKPVRFAKSAYRNPVVTAADLPPRMRDWARSRAVPKVIVATQTRVIEAVVDPDGSLLPSVPVLTAMAMQEHDEWHILAALMSPVASVVAARRHLGAGLSAGSIKMSAMDMGRLPAPTDIGTWHHGADLARAIQLGDSTDLELFGRTMCSAYGMSNADADAAMKWWLPRVTR